MGRAGPHQEVILLLANIPRRAGLVVNFPLLAVLPEDIPLLAVLPEDIPLREVLMGVAPEDIPLLAVLMVALLPAVTDPLSTADTDSKDISKELSSPNGPRRGNTS